MNIFELIDIFEKYSKVKKNIEEQETANADASSTSSTSTGGSKYPTVTKWDSGVTRGPANQIGNTKWSDIVKITRGKSNPIDTKSKWDSGVKRGKSNTLL